MANAGARRLDYIDGLRLVGAGAVVVQHLFERFPAPWARAVIAPAPGVFGVVLFFVISGLVIPFSVRDELNLREFAVRRLFRIYPLFLVVIVLALLAGASGVSPHFARIAEAGIGQWAANLLLVQDFVGVRAFYSVSWTLTIEFIWYGLFAILLRTAGAQAGTISAVAAPALMLLLTVTSLAIDTRIPLGRSGMVYAAVLGYQTYRYLQGDITGKLWRLQVAGFLVVTVISNSVAFGYFRHPNITLLQAIGPWTAALLLFVLAVSVPGLRGRRALAQPWVVALGATSYSIYMMHPLAIAAAVHLGAPVLVVPAALLLTSVMAALGYHYVERPGIRLGRIVIDRFLTEPKPAYPRAIAPLS